MYVKFQFRNILTLITLGISNIPFLDFVRAKIYTYRISLYIAVIINKSVAERMPYGFQKFSCQDVVVRPGGLDFAREPLVESFHKVFF